MSTQIDYHLQAGMQLLARGEFFEAHEEWEIPWVNMTGDKRSFWQAMIQLSVGAFHYQRNNMTGCYNLWKKALIRCQNLRKKNSTVEPHLTIELLKLLESSLRQLDSGKNPLPEIQAFAELCCEQKPFNSQK
ncbi:MAG: DUF309 domain-containing protein [Calditrichaeota bacterium]|nr:MAG: DUF309 domain-containing protein [Calditrichota bacterium]